MAGGATPGASRPAVVAARRTSYAARAMNVLRGWLFDHLGLKLTALLLAVLVYLNVYTDRPATLRIAFPVELTDLADTLAISGPAPRPVEADLKGTGKQIIALKVREPKLQLSLGGVAAGRFQRTITAADLPLPVDGVIHVEQLVGPPMVELQVEPRLERELPLALTVVGVPASGWHWNGDARLDPSRITVSGPRSVIAALDTIRLAPVRVDGRRDTVRADVAPADLPEWCTARPALVHVRAPLARR